MQITAGSYSRLTKFEACPKSAKIAFIDKVPEPPRPLPEGKTEHANERGTRIHEAAEHFVKGGVELIPELKNFEKELLEARKYFAAGQASTEGDWGYDKDWNPVAWMSDNVYIRIKIDLVIHLSKKEIVVVDYKSGKRAGNEIKHNEQLILYVIACIFRFPDVEKITSELWYTDIDELVSKTYTREQGLRFVKNFETRFHRMTDAVVFPPRPSNYTCKWCPWKPIEKGGTGHCNEGI